MFLLGNFEPKLIKNIIAVSPSRKLRFVLDTLSSESNQQLADYLGETHEDEPLVYIIDTREGTHKKFKMAKKVGLKNIISFIDEWRFDKLIPTYRTEQVPAETHDGNICVLVGSNFIEQIALKEEVVVIFYAPWCKHS